MSENTSLPVEPQQPATPPAVSDDEELTVRLAVPETPTGSKSMEPPSIPAAAGISASAVVPDGPAVSDSGSSPPAPAAAPAPGPAVADRPVTEAPPVAPKEAFPVNVLIDDRYRLDGILGSGGMGVVYRAFDVRLERVVALKTIRFQESVDEAKAENLVKRFIRECKVVAGLNHPNVVTVYDAGASNDILYLVMEYIEGKTLADALREKGTFQLQEAVDCIAQVCDGLACAHEHGVTHRDIKPANIMLLRNGLVKVMDFGLARGEDLSQGTQLTAGLVVGTPEFMAPEQIKNEGVDHRSDIFSTGVVLYTLLTGDRPFRGKQVMEIISSILFGTAQPPSLKREDLNAKVDAVVLRFLAKDQNERYANAKEAAEAVRSLLQPVPSEVPEVLDGMSFRRSLVETLPLPLARLYSRTFNTKDPRDRLSNTLFMTEAYVKLLSSICVAHYLQKLPPDPAIDESLQTLALPMLRDWLRWIQQIGNHCASLPEKKGSYPVRLLKALIEVRPEHENLRRGCQALGEVLAQPVEEVSVLEFVRLAVELREKGAAKDELPVEQAESIGIAMFNAFGDAMFLVDPLLRGQILFMGESTRLSDGTVETPRLSLQSALPLRISPLRSTALQFQPESLYYFPLGEDDSWSISSFITYLEHDLGADFYFLHYDLRTGEVHFLSYNTGQRYLSVSLAEEQVALISRVYGRELSSSQVKALRESIRAQHLDKLPKLGVGAPRGQISGDFEILEKIGEGGMGMVYKARQLSLNRIVALKVLARGRADNELMVARFKREVATLASCDHPNVVKILDSGFEKGEYYYAMEYIDGVTLSDLYSRVKDVAKDNALGWDEWCKVRDELIFKRQGPRRASELAEKTYYETIAVVGRDVAYTLHHIHELGIIHRDVKPSNIMLTRAGRVVLMDFGLAKGQTDLTMTVADHALGTVRYASPEQLQSRKLGLDHRTDVYSLGATLYELAGLQPVFEGETEVELITKLMYEEPVPLRKLNDEIPADLEVIIRKAMMKRPEARYLEASEVAEDLENFLQGRHIKARPPSLTTVLLGTVRRHKEASVTAVTALLLVIAATVWAFLNISAERNLAQQALQQANRNLTLAYANEGSFFLDRNRPLDAAFSFYRALRLEDTPAVRAGFLRAIYRSPSLAAVLVGHAGPIRALAIHPQGTILASGDEDGVLKLWNLNKQREIATLAAHERGVLALAIGPEGEKLVSASQDQTLKLWSVSRQQVVASQTEPERLHSIAIRPDGMLLATGSEAGNVKLWDLSGGLEQSLATLRGHSSLIFTLAFSTDGQILASGSADNTVKLWDLDTQSELVTFEHSSKVQSVAFSPNGRLLASASADGIVKLWNLEEQHEIATVRGEPNESPAVVFSPDGRTLAFLGPNCTIRLWSVSEQHDLAIVPGHTHPLRAVLFSPDRKTLISAGDDQAIKLWNLSPQRNLRTFTGHTGYVRAVAISPDGRILASGGADTTLRLWNLHGASDESFATFEHSDDVFAVDFSRDGRSLASGSGDGSIQIWDVIERKAVASLPGHEDLVWTLRFSPDGRWLASGSEDGVIKIWDLKAASLEMDEAFATLKGHSLGVNALVFTPDGKTLLSGSDDQTIKLWDVQAKREIDTLSGHTGFVYSLAVSPDGSTLASGSADLVAKLWDLAGRHEIATLTGHTDLVWSVAFSPDGKTLASGSYDDTVRLWDVPTRRAIATLVGPAHHISSVAFSPDGKTLASGSHDRTILLWDLSFLSRPLSQILSETKQEFLLPYRDSRFQPRFFASIATAVEDLLRARGKSVPLEAAEELLWKFRDTGLSPSDMVSLVYLLGPDNEISITATPSAVDLYTQQDWRSKPSKHFLLSAGQYFLSRRSVKLADRCFLNAFSGGSGDPRLTLDKAAVAMDYIQLEVRSELPLTLAREAAQERPDEPWFQLVYSLALIAQADYATPLPILRGLSGKFEGQFEREAAFLFALGACQFKAGQKREGAQILKRLTETTQGQWGRRAADLLADRGSPQAPAAPDG
jgi:WD40 repeat protein/tRNA A-37 threonylcarbamoyl transferase component Bud32